MYKKTKLNYVILLIGILTIISGFYIISKNILDSCYIGIIFGLGAGMVGVGTINTFQNLWYKKNPQMEKLIRNNFNDERNKLLYYKTSAKINKINMFVLSIIVVIASIFKLPPWIIFSLSGLLLCDIILYFLIFTILDNKSTKK